MKLLSRLKTSLDEQSNSKMILQWVEECLIALGRQIAMDGLEVKKLW